MKSLNDICFIIQARLDSKRLPGKMLLPFAGSTLFDIAVDKLVNSEVVPNSNIFLSLYDEELIRQGSKYPVNIFYRTAHSVTEAKTPREVSEWGWKLDYKYFITLNACAPLLSIRTIENFVEHFIESPHKSLFSVHQTKNFYWNEDREMITPYPGSLDTKLVNTTYSGAHVLYAGSMEDMSNNVYLGDFTENYPELFTVEEKETFDVDFEWQFKVAEILYNNRNKFLG
jgi:CMP-N-acetylneuraminic acid synthetase